MQRPGSKARPPRDARRCLQPHIPASDASVQHTECFSQAKAPSQEWARCHSGWGEALSDRAIQLRHWRPANVRLVSPGAASPLGSGSCRSAEGKSGAHTSPLRDPQVLPVFTVLSRHNAFLRTMNDGSKSEKQTASPSFPLTQNSRVHQKQTAQPDDGD